MITITAPMPPEPGDVFLAGGIGDGLDWREQVRHLLREADGILLDPRLTGDPTTDEVLRNVRWEHRSILMSQTILFWFPADSTAAVSMFELGVCVGRGQAIVVGADIASPRRAEVIAQLAVADPSVAVYGTIEDTVAAYLATTR